MTVFSYITNKYSKYGEELNSHDLFKFAALVIMTIDHLGYYIFPDQLWWRVIGRCTFPVWFFLVGYARNLNIKKDICLLALAMILLRATLMKVLFPVNALVTIILCRLLLQFLHKHNYLAKNPANVFITCIIFLLPTMMFCEYGTQALLYACMGYMVRNDLRQKQYRWFFFLTLVTFVMIQIYFFHFTDLQSVLVILTTGYVTWLLYNYQVRKITIKWHGVRNVIKFLSRYSLYYYMIHITILQIIWVKFHQELYNSMKFSIIY